MRLVLASASPRRLELLRRIGLRPEVDPARIEEVPITDEAPEGYVARLAREKAEAVGARHPDALVLAGDTVVVLDDRILEKPGTPREAREMLRLLSGRDHHVLTALALRSPGGLHGRVDRARVRFRTLDAAEIVAYVGTGEPMDKAGAYGIQGVGGALVQEIEGDYSAVVGLSLAGTVELLRRAGWSWRPDGIQPAN